MGTAFDQELEERFLRYVKIDTTADPASQTSPSSGGQYDLLNLVAEELREIGAQDVKQQHMAILANRGDGVHLQASAEGTRLLLIAGRPLNEPIVQYGPFVMNTKQEILQAVEDFNAGRLA